MADLVPELVGDIWPVVSVEAVDSGTITGIVPFPLVVVPDVTVEFKLKVAKTLSVPVGVARLGEPEDKGDVESPCAISVGVEAGAVRTRGKEKEKRVLSTANTGMFAPRIAFFLCHSRGFSGVSENVQVSREIRRSYIRAESLTGAGTTTDPISLHRKRNGGNQRNSGTNPLEGLHQQAMHILIRISHEGRR